MDSRPASKEHHPSQHSQNSNPAHWMASLQVTPTLTYSKLNEEGLHSLLGLTISESEFNSHFYRTRSDLLKGVPVTESMRARIRLWVFEEGSRRFLSRKACCLANTLVDLFLIHGGTVSVDELQLLVLSVLRMANKLSDHIVLSISHEVFPKAKLDNWQEKVCLRLGFRLTPITYVQFTDALLCAWNAFSKMHSLWSYQGFGNMTSNFKRLTAHKIFQLIDFVYLFSKALEFPKGLLQYQIFKLFLKRDHISLDFTPPSIEDEVLISFWNNPEEVSYRNEPFDKILHEFEVFIHKLFPWMAEYQQSSKKKVALWIQELDSYGIHFSFEPKFQVWRQSFHESWLPCFKGIIQPFHVKGQRKKSIDTTS